MEKPGFVKKLKSLKKLNLERASNRDEIENKFKEMISSHSKWGIFGCLILFRVQNHNEEQKNVGVSEEFKHRNNSNKYQSFNLQRTGNI